MESSLPITTMRRSHLLLSLALSLILLPSAINAAAGGKSVLTYHNGPVLSGNVNLALIWYGQVGRVQKSAIRTFIRSLNGGVARGVQPQVSNWWQMVESYQSAASGRGRGRGRGRASPTAARINVRVVRQVVDRGYSIGKVLIADFIPPLVQKATGGLPNTVAVIFAAKDVTVQDACTGKCSVHGTIGNKQPYIIVGNPETECPGVCGWPFHEADYGTQGGSVFRPPSGNIGADSLVMHFASALAATVSNPYNTGFFTGPSSNEVESASACPGMFGSGAFPGYTGKVLVDPRSGGAFNAIGWRGKKFLLPALWNPSTSSCWTNL